MRKMQAEDKDHRRRRIGQPFLPHSERLSRRCSAESHQPENGGDPQREEQRRDEQPPLRARCDLALSAQFSHRHAAHVAEVERHHGQDAGRKERQQPGQCGPAETHIHQHRLLPEASLARKGIFRLGYFYATIGLST
jgi:hypothetical protein